MQHMLFDLKGDCKISASVAPLLTFREAWNIIWLFLLDTDRRRIYFQFQLQCLVQFAALLATIQA